MHHLLGLAALLASTTCLAERIDPFVVTVPVADQGAAERREAERSALRQALIRLSGQTDRVDAALEGRGRLLQAQQIRYVERPAEEPDAPPGLALEARFAPQSVIDLARQLTLPIWPLERGACIVWVAIDDGNRRELLGEDFQHTPLQQVLIEAAADRGLPLLLPLLDLEDRQQVTVSDVWAGFFDQLEAASERYGASTVLAGRLFRLGDGWVGRWQLREPQLSERWEREGPDLETVLADGVAQAAERLGQRHAVQVLQYDERLIVRVSEIASASDYARAMHYLDSLSVVDSVDLVAVAPGYVDLALATGVSAEVIAQTIGLERTLEAVTSRPDPLGAPNRLHFRLAR